MSIGTEATVHTNPATIEEKKWHTAPSFISTKSEIKKKLLALFSIPSSTLLWIMLDHLRGWLLWLVNKTTAVFPWPPWPSVWLVQLPSITLSPLPHEISEPKRRKHFCSCASAEKRRSLLLCYQRVKDPLWYDSKVICVRVIFPQGYRLLQTIRTSVKLAYITVASDSI